MGKVEYSGYEDSSDDEETTNSTTEKEGEVESQSCQPKQLAVNTALVDANDEQSSTVSNVEETTEVVEYTSDPRSVIQDVFELFQLEFQSSVNDSFQRISDCADKFQDLDQELFELSSDVSAEHYVLKEKKRCAVDSVESLK